MSRGPMGVPGMMPPPNEDHKSLYVGNLDPRVTEMMLADVFRTMGEVVHVKIIPDKNFQHNGFNFGFVDFADHRSALAAVETLNGRSIMGAELKVNWAHQGTQGPREDTTNHFHVFVGDLSSDVTDQVLNKAFSAFGSLSDARVMWDNNTGKSRGYGFLSFREKHDAERAIASMNGEWLGTRAIRVNWANQKSQNQAPMPDDRDRDRRGGSLPPPTPAQPSLHFETVLHQAPATNVTVYVGNLAHALREADLYPYFQQYGFVHEIRLQSERGFAFVVMDTHEHAAMAICYLNGANIMGRSVKCSWGKEKFADARPPLPPMHGGAPDPYAQMPPMQDPAAAAAAAYAQQYAAYYAAAGYPPAAAAPMAVPDPSTVPPLSDPIAAADAAAAQDAVAFQIQLMQQQQQQAAAAAAAVDPQATAANPRATYYYAYYLSQQNQADPAAAAATAAAQAAAAVAAVTSGAMPVTAGATDGEAQAAS
ncbi:hypothetical protein AMAG_16557 [Allomyces macrogynus ATCC 38327]|uniref:RRM domain-containing protein n=1 Tax=Allomyces macrogynus (strain ATCC 38327) TaxID=578462 RepID=A0A0L0TDA3_ALLM3|nr:hypothetical protein AMAG_16557 [Allomyces macrogynus ATCC 38327]|eukprot:KNE72514.1 hypothetical protein AMAG_16557 [Allomyces macrogynus ATCC 38327]